MYKDKKVLCIIPARGGSKGVPGKNIKLLLGKPLIAYTIEQAQESGYIDRLIVSTDSPDIAQVAERCGASVPFLRPAELATDDSGTIEVLLHALSWLEAEEKSFFDIIVLLHVTAPLRQAQDIDNCVDLLMDKNADSVFSVNKARKNPYFNMVELDAACAVRLSKQGDFTCRQAAPEVYDINGSVYVWRAEGLKSGRKVILNNSRIYLMPPERSIDIDTCLDFKLAELLLRERGAKER